MTGYHRSRAYRLRAQALGSPFSGSLGSFAHPVAKVQHSVSGLRSYPLFLPAGKGGARPEPLPLHLGGSERDRHLKPLSEPYPKLTGCSGCVWVFGVFGATVRRAGGVPVVRPPDLEVLHLSVLQVWASPSNLFGVV